MLSFTFKVSKASNKRRCTKKRTNGLIAGQGRHAHIKSTDSSIYANLTHLNIILSFTFKVSIASNKKKCTKNEQMVLLLGKENTPTSNQLTIVFALT